MAEYVRVDNLEVSDYVTVWDCNCSEYGKQTVMAVDDLQYLPTADVVEVVRCGNCRKRNTEECWCSRWEDDYETGFDENGFCSGGERRDT